MSKQNTSRHDIQFLRAVAVLAVIGYHFGIAGFGGGFVGVDIFFVISGYLIFGKVHAQFVRGEFSLKRFFEARMRRIFPALAVMVIATALWGWYFMLPRDYMYFSRTALAALFFVSNHSFMGLQGYFDAASHTKPLLHTWSLAIEGQFYFWLPLILIVIFKVRQGMRVPVLLGMVAVASLAWTLWLAYTAPESGFYFVLARAWEFVAGAICALLLPERSRYGKMLLLACTTGLLLSVSLLGGTGPWPNLWTLLPVIFAAVFIYTAAHAQKKNPVIAHPGFQLIGDMSYSLYLWHWPVWVYALQLYDGKIPPAHKVALLLLVFALSYVSWRWIERPFRIKNRVGTRPLMTATVAVLLSAVVFVAFAVVTKGAPNRFPDYISRVAIQSAQNTPRNECFRNMHGTKDVQEMFCTFGVRRPASDASAMMWGDSYANQYMTALGNASEKLGITGLIATMSGCQAFIVNESTKSTASPACNNFNREVYTYLQSHPEIKTVVLGRGGWNVDETVFLIRHLISQNRKVILMAPSPSPGMNVETAWATQQIRAQQPIEEIKLEKSPKVTQSTILDDLNGRLKAEITSGQLYLIDPTKRFCDDLYCYLVRDGIATFRDNGHFTEIAALQMEPDFHAALVWAK
jgi:peptidoglycan/LPS O-acetylase OafA/YrhL